MLQAHRAFYRRLSAQEPAVLEATAGLVAAVAKISESAVALGPKRMEAQGSVHSNSWIRLLE